VHAAYQYKDPIMLRVLSAGLQSVVWKGAAADRFEKDQGSKKSKGWLCITGAHFRCPSCSAAGLSYRAACRGPYCNAAMGALPAAMPCCDLSAKLRVVVICEDNAAIQAAWQWQLRQC